LETGVKPLDVFFQNQRIAKVGRFIRGGTAVLDIGTRDGALFQRLKQIRTGVGIDPIVPEVIQGANYILLPGRFPEALPPGETFDVVTMLAVIEHMEASQRSGIDELCARRLNPGGLLILTVPSRRVDSILTVLKKLRLIDGQNIEEHYGFDPNATPDIFPPPRFRLRHHETFQMGLNHLYVFEKE
jgi:2-polyprenyl-3-methyl-5-hydroxy-6-metoxy-1,4-benzoquinol methylase